MSNYNYHWTNYNDDLAIMEQRAIAIYENVHGHVVIRQKGGDGEKDSIVIVKAQNVERTTDKLNEVASEILAKVA